MDLSKPLEDYQLAFLDLETTGLDVITGDAICEIGLLKVKQRKIIDKFQSLVNPKKPMPEGAYRVHGISDQELQYAPPFEKIAERVLNFFKGCVLCAYNVKFDLGFIDHSLQRMNLEALTMPTIDILSMARDLLSLPRYNLETVAKHLAIDCRSLHRALDDVLITYQVFLKLTDICKEKNIRNLDHYISLYSCENQIFKAQENQKVAIVKEAIANNAQITIEGSFNSQAIAKEQVLPLRIFREGRFLYLLCQVPTGTTKQVDLRRVLDIQPVGRTA